MRRITWLSRWTMLLAGISVPSVGRGQAAGLQRQFAVFRDSVAQISTAAEAAQLDADRRARLHGHSSDPALLILAGLARLRLGQLSEGRAGLDEAQRIFDEAVLRAPDDWAWPWYGLALADLALDRSDAVVKRSTHSGPGVYYHDAALHALGKALEADAAFVPAAELLGDVLLPFGERSLKDELTRAVRRAAASNQAASPWLALGRLYRNLHHSDSAIIAFQQYLTLGGDSGLGLLEEARSRFARGQMKAASTAYYTGARVADALARQAYRRDLGWVASPEELEAFDHLAGDSLEPFVRAFWAKRDAEEMRSPGERLREHVRRWRYVFEHFQLSARAEGTPQRGGANCGPGMFPSLRDDPSSHAHRSTTVAAMVPADLQLFEPGVFAATWRGKRLVDDRGLIYMRHGEPDMRAAASLEQARYSTPPQMTVASSTSGKTRAQLGILNPNPTGLSPISEAEEAHQLTGHVQVSMAPTPAQTETRPNESWKYVTPHGSLIFHFCGSMALGTTAATTLVEMLPLSPEMIGARSGMDPRFAVLEGQLLTFRSGSGNLPSGARELARELIEAGRRDIATGLSTDEYAPEFKHDITPFTQFYAVGQPDDGSSALLAIFAFPGENLIPATLPDGRLVYPISFRLIATDAAGHIVRIDTTRYFTSPDTLFEKEYLYGMESLPLGPGTWKVRLLATEPGLDAGGAVERPEVTIHGGSALLMSDLVLGRLNSGLTWTSVHGAVPLSPLDFYSRSGSVEVYYEVSGAVTGQTYHTDLELTGLSGRFKGNVRLSFDERATGAVLRIRRSVDLGHLKGGRYRMSVTVTEKDTGRSVTGTRILNVMK
jgi:tetratricopeptide (TPR) repeat protein